MADLFDMKVGGLGFHLTAHLIALAALFVACFAITGYITFRDNSVPQTAIDGEDTNLAELTVTGLATFSGGVKHDITLIPDAADDITITLLESGKIYHFGTTTGAVGAADGNNSMTFQLPTPSAAGEVITLYHTNAAAVAKILGFSTTLPASQTIKYWAYAQPVFIKAGTTVTGVNGTANSMVKLSASSTILGDIYTFTSMSTTVWRLDINDATNLLAAGDIAVDPGNVLGYID